VAAIDRAWVGIANGVGVESGTVGAAVGSTGEDGSSLGLDTAAALLSAVRVLDVPGRYLAVNGALKGVA
jgi:hypothetical protein